MMHESHQASIVDNSPLHHQREEDVAIGDDDAGIVIGSERTHTRTKAANVNRDTLAEQIIYRFFKIKPLLQYGATNELNSVVHQI